uniref:DNA-directed RNA polymerase II subunit RPB9-like zinc ribbon domain-containing protein n=1 Tax=Sus scrofa TaxID=9823 RepID=A0A8D0NTA9_PIG
MMLWEPACRSAHWECGADVPTGGLIAERRPPGPMGSSGRPEAPGVHGQGAAGSVGWAVVMLLFCPGCGNGLIVEEGQRCHRFACNTCPYVHNITRKVTNRKYPKLKEVDDVLGGAAAWENVDSTAGERERPVPGQSCGWYGAADSAPPWQSACASAKRKSIFSSLIIS